MRSSSSQGLDSSSSQLPGVRRLVERWGTRGIGCAEDRTGVLDCGCYTKFDDWLDVLIDMLVCVLRRGTA
jgi:hypothetical protein